MQSVLNVITSSPLISSEKASEVSLSAASMRKETFSILHSCLRGQRFVQISPILIFSWLAKHKKEDIMK